MSHTPTSRRDFLARAAQMSAATALLSRVFPFREALAQEVKNKAAEAGRDFRNLREAYDLSADVSYFNHASIGTVPREVNRARQAYLQTCEQNPWLHVWGDVWKAALDESRVKAADFLGCSPSTLAIIHNTTEAFNVLAHGLSLEKGDEILFSSLNHVGASACWEHLANTRGYVVKRFDFPLMEAPDLSPNDVVSLHLEQITDRTRVLVFPHIDNILGVRHPVKRLAKEARARGVEFIAVDGAQAVGMLPVHIDELGVDFYATSAHKWLQSPKGTGLFYVAKSAQKSLRPMWVTWGQRRWENDARRFEDYGTRDPSAVLGLGHAADFQARLDPTKKERHLHALWNRIRERVEASPRLIWRSPSRWDLSASLVAVEVKGRASADVFKTLYAESGFVFRPFSTDGLNTLRISSNAMNRADELDRLLDALEHMAS